MNTHTFNVLEYDKLKKEIMKYTILDTTRLKIEELTPFSDINIIKKELLYVSEVVEIEKYDEGLDLVGINDISKYIKRTELIGTYLIPEEFVSIKRTLRAFRRVKTKLENLESKYRNLYMKFRDVPVYKGLEDIIEKAIDDSGEVKDEASLELRSIREQKKNISLNIKNKFDDIMSNTTYAKAIQEKIITEREGRMVIPIKADFKGQIKGIEHDRSASGQTVFIEPLSVVSLNNKMRELQVREREEIKKILLRTTDMLRMNKEGILKIADAVVDIDFIYSKARYALEINAIMPKIVEKEYLKLVEARHPFIEKDKVVPLSFEIGKEYNTLLITGPNTGGKTVALKTAGLLTLMALSGIMVPANEKTEIGMFTGVYADIGDEQSIEQSLSSFSAHLKNVHDILENINKSSLVLLDELGSGTDPIEGSAFAMAVIDYLKSKKVKSFITTHYSEVKAYAFNEENVETASMEFDANTLSPTYRLLLGIPGESNALKIASRLGLPNEIIERAQKYISEEDKKVENMIANIKEKTEEMEKAQAEIEELKRESERLKKEYEAKVIELEKEKNRILKEAYDNADKMIKEAQNKAKALIDKIKKDEIKKEELKATEKSLNMLRQNIREEKTKNVKVEKKIKINLDLKIGEKVFIKSLNQDGVVIKDYPDKEKAQIQAGILKLMVNYDDIKKSEQVDKQKYIRVNNVRKSNVKSEIDLRGKMLEEAIYDLEKYLDDAILNGYKEVYVIHGKGTGVLRKGIHEYLETASFVESFKIADQNQGGYGCTVVTLK
ncbi:MAG: MutS2 family protein [Fusobacteriales bacterium]|jgi:DNA mismatch repair protein MutS2|nr:MutS2 family protein [Fusobacteriales bacterium]